MCTTLYFHFCIPCSVLTTKNLVSICHRVCSLLPISPCPRSIPSGNHYFVLCICMFVFVWFVHLFCFCLFLYSTNEWDHMVFVFLCLTYFTWHNMPKVHPCCHKWQDFFFFFMAEKYSITCVCVCVCVCVYHIFFIHSSQWALKLLPYLGYYK